ncbi:unnamed protein product [Rodentolepis nana]|uniref:UBA domain-containing protein n=1 Tax=Rodentolepis nana TaxID=102285 RepID=A0A0R3TWP5_RODNA|nr:unnamed protein product [Rodentolepis nana]
MSSKSNSRDGFTEVSADSLKETSSSIHQYFHFDRLRRTKSMPKRSQPENPNLTPRPPEPSPSKHEYFKGLNSAKSRFFHSCRISKSEKSEKFAKRPFSPIVGKYSQLKYGTRPSLMFETGSMATSVFFDEKEDRSSSSGNTCSYVHPMLAELEAEITTPLPPPRACPYWLKSALERSQDSADSSSKAAVPNPVDITSLAASVYSEDGSFLNYFDEESDGTEDVRIYPVMQNGVKISDTHYWVINPPKSRSKQRKETGTSFCNGKGANYAGRPTSLSAKAIDDNRSHYENLPDILACSSPGTNQSGDEFQSVKLRRGRSECHKEVLRLVQQTLVEKLQYEVPTARLDECRAVLIGSSWNFQKAERRLKVELLCRMGYVSKSSCERLLERLNWNFDEAYELLRKSGNIRQIPSSYSHSSTSAGVSASVTPDNSPDIIYLNNSSPPIHD